MELMKDELINFLVSSYKLNLNPLQFLRKNGFNNIIWSKTIVPEKMAVFVENNQLAVIEGGKKIVKRL